MPIRFPEPPGRVGQAREDVPLPAQPVYTLGLDDLLGVEGEAEAARSVSAPPTWRYSRFDAAGRAEVLELPDEHDAGALATGDDRFGPMIREALAIANQDPRVGDNDYEARLFRVPALSLLALWLHAPTVFDLFVALSPSPRELEPNRVYEDAEFMSLVRRAAERMGAHYDDADESGELGS